jgi:beta-lactamase regulating signal transducer with metallopeptidase domain
MIPTMIEAALRSLLVALAVWAGLRAFRVRNVLAQKACWGLVLTASVLMPLFVQWSAKWQVWHSGATLIVPLHFSTTQPASRPTLPAAAASVPEEFKISTALPDTTLVPALKSACKAEVAEPAKSMPSPVLPAVYAGVPAAPAGSQLDPKSAPISTLSLVAVIYLAVASAFTFRVFYGLASAVLLWLNAEPVPVADASEFTGGISLRVSRAVASPVTIGSAVVLPADYTHWDAEKLRIVMAHERSHIRQGDFYLQLLAAFYAASFWISPLGWWLKRELSDLAETISDRAGLEQAASLSSYAQILLEFAAAPRPTPIGVAMARSGSLSRRIDRLLNDSSFRQAFAGGRRRVLVAVVLVPIALFGATCLVRVQAAQQAPDTQSTPAAQPAPAALPEAPITGQSNPGPETAPAPEVGEPRVEMDTGGPIAPGSVAPVVAPVPPNPGVAPPPAVQEMTVIPLGASVMPMAPVTPLAPTVPAVSVVRVAPVIHIASGSAFGVGVNRSFAFAQDSQSTTVNGHRSSYHYSSSGDSYAIISGDDRDKFEFSGDIHTSEIDKARKMAHGDFLWFRHEDKEYFVDDPAIVSGIEGLYKPMDELGKQQEALGRRQEALGKQQEALGRLQEQASVPAPDLRKEMAEISDAMAKLQAKMGKNITQDELGDLQDKLGELQGRLGDLQGMVGAKQGELGAQQGKLGEEQGKLGEEQGKLGAEQGRIAQEADLKVRSIIDESLHNGKAHPVE